MDILIYFQAIGKRLKKIGASAIYSALLLYYAYRDSDTPMWAKHIITGALAYLVSPIDSIPDLTPFLGYTDDMSVLSFALVGVACYITDDIRAKAKDKLSTWIKGDFEVEVAKVDAVL